MEATYRQTGASRTEEEPRRKKCDEERRRGRRSGWRRERGKEAGNTTLSLLWGSLSVWAEKWMSCDSAVACCN